MIKKLIDYANEVAVPLEVYCTKRNEVTIAYLDDKLKSYEIMDIKNYLIKGIIDNCVVTTKVEDIQNPEEIIAILKKTRELIDEKNIAKLADEGEISNINRTNINIDLEEVKNNLKSLIELKKEFKEIVSINSMYNFENSEYELQNTNGANFKDVNIHGYYYADVVLSFGDKSDIVDKFVMDKVPDFAIFKDKLIRAIKDMLLKHNSTSTKTNKYNIILSNKSVFEILNAFILDFHAEVINKGNSPFINKFNEQIFSPLITIVEDPANQKLIGSRMFDDEGTKTFFKNIVEKGVFKNKLYNKKYAELEKTVSTGNSFGIRNMYLVPGEISKSELFKKLNNGFYINNLMGLHSGINHVTGDISLQCEGFVIENGKMTRGLNQVILATNIFELLNNVKEIASDLEFFSSYGGAASILAENITIAGKEV